VRVWSVARRLEQRDVEHGELFSFLDVRRGVDDPLALRLAPPVPAVRQAGVVDARHDREQADLVLPRVVCVAPEDGQQVALLLLGGEAEIVQLQECGLLAGRRCGSQRR
jgi:hypothetical protein